MEATQQRERWLRAHRWERKDVTDHGWHWRVTYDDVGVVSLVQVDRHPRQA